MTAFRSHSSNPQGSMAARVTLPLSYLLDGFGKSYTEAIFKLKKTVWKPVFNLCVRVQTPSVLLADNCFFFFFFFFFYFVLF